MTDDHITPIMTMTLLCLVDIAWHVNKEQVPDTQFIIYVSKWLEVIVKWNSETIQFGALFLWCSDNNFLNLLMGNFVGQHTKADLTRSFLAVARKLPYFFCLFISGSFGSKWRHLSRWPFLGIISVFKDESGNICFLMILLQQDLN